MTARKVTAKDGADVIAMLDTERKARTPRTPRLHLDAKTGATVLTPKVAPVKKTTKATPVKKTALTSDKLDLRPVVKVTKSSLVRAEFEKGASLTEAAKATGVDAAFVWDLASAWQKKTGRVVPRNGRVAAVAKKPTAVKKTPVKKVAAVATEKAEDAS